MHCGRQIPPVRASTCMRVAMTSSSCFVRSFFSLFTVLFARMLTGRLIVDGASSPLWHSWSRSRPVLRRKRRARPLDVTLDEDPHHLHQPATRSRQTPPPPAAAPAGIPAGLRWRRRSADSDRGSRCGRSGRREHYSAAARHSTCRRIPRECSPGRRER